MGCRNGYILTKQGENGCHYFDQKAIERLLFIKELSRDRCYSIKQNEYYLSTGQNPKPEKSPEDVDRVKIDQRAL